MSVYYKPRTGMIYSIKLTFELYAGVGYISKWPLQVFLYIFNAGHTNSILASLNKKKILHLIQILAKFPCKIPSEQLRMIQVLRQ